MISAEEEWTHLVSWRQIHAQETRCTEALSSTGLLSPPKIIRYLPPEFKECSQSG